MDNGFDFFGFSFESVIGGFIAIMIFAGVFNFVKSIFVTIYNKFFWNEDKQYHSKEEKTFTDSFLENSKKENIEELQYEIDEVDQEEKLEDLKEHLSNQEFIHNEALNYMEWTGYYITNYKDKKSWKMELMELFFAI